MDKRAILTWIDANRAPFETLALEIWASPELAYQEHEAARLQMDFLRQRGFKVVQKGDMPTAFMAEWGEGDPVVGILGEYDALAGMSQTVSTRPEATAPKASGHGCGHNLLGVGGLMAACAVKEVFASQGIQGTVRYYGCPAEEVLTGKGDMAKDGYFSGTAVACSGGSLGLKGMVLAAKTLAGTVYDLAVDPSLVRRAREEFDAGRKGRVYRPIGALLSAAGSE